MKYSIVFKEDSDYASVVLEGKPTIEQVQEG